MSDMRPIEIMHPSKFGASDVGDFQVVNDLVGSLLVGYMPDGYVAPAILPVVDVNHQQGTYPTIDQGPFFRSPDALRAPGTAPKEVTYTVGSGTYFARNYELGGNIPWEWIANARPPHAPVVQTGQLVKAGLMLGYEQRVRSLIVSGVGSVITNTAATAAAWDQPATSTPLDQIDAMIQATRRNRQVTPNLAILGPLAWRYLKRHPQVIRALFPGAGVGGQMATEAQLAQLIGVNRVVVAGAIENTGAEPVGGIPDTGTYSDVWSSHFILVHVASNPGIMVPSFGYAFRWSGPEIGAGAPGNFAVQERNNTKTKAREIQMGYYQDERIVDSALATMIVTGITA